MKLLLRRWLSPRRCQRKVEFNYLQGYFSHNFGQYAVVIGKRCCRAILYYSRYQHTFTIHHAPANTAGIVADYEHLPLLPESVDLITIMYSLRDADEPQQMLREVHQALMSNGKLLLFDDNPISLVGLILAIKQQRLIHPRRLSDWLRLLSFNEIHYRYYCPRLAIWTEKAPARWRRPLRWLNIVLPNFCKYMYVIEATKFTGSYLLTRSQQQLIRPLIGMRPAAACGQSKHRIDRET